MQCPFNAFSESMSRQSLFGCKREQRLYIDVVTRHSCFSRQILVRTLTVADLFTRNPRMLYGLLSMTHASIMLRAPAFTTGVDGWMDAYDL